MVYFILGMLTVQFIFPLLEGITAVLLSGLEALKGYFGIKIAEYNSNIRKISLNEPEITRPIGFCYEDGEENDE